MSKTDPSSSPEPGASFDAQRTQLEGPTRTEADPRSASRPARREVDDNWSLSASMAVPRVTGLASAVADPEAPTIPAPGPVVEEQDSAPMVQAPVVPAGAARPPLSRAELRLLGGKTMQGVGPAISQRRPAAGPGSAEGEAVSPGSLQARHGEVQFSAAGASAPLYLDEPAGVLRLSTDTSELSVPEIDAGTSATTMLPGNRAASPYASGGGADEVDDDVGELAEPPPPIAGALHVEHTPAHLTGQPSSTEISPLEPSEPRGRVGAGPAPMSALEAPMAVAPAIALAGARPPYAPELVPGTGRTEAEWFEPSGGVAAVDAHALAGGRSADHSFTDSTLGRKSAGKFTLPLLVFAAVSAVVFAGAYVYSRGRGPAAPAASSTASSAASSAAGSSAASASSASASSSSLVDIRFDSTPPGAKVVLVERGHAISTEVGTTPVRAAVDPNGSYDAIFTLEGRPTRMLPVNIAAAHVIADFSTPELAAVAATAPDGGAPTTDPGATAGSGEPVAKDPSKDSSADSGAIAKNDKRDKGGKRVTGGKRHNPRESSGVDDEEEDEDDGPTVPAVDPSAIGRLTVSTKPPCQISINGKAHGSTPLREVPLPAGIYRLTLVNKELSINETMAIRVTAGKETKVTQDYAGTPEP